VIIFCAKQQLVTGAHLSPKLPGECGAVDKARDRGIAHLLLAERVGQVSDSRGPDTAALPNAKKSLILRKYKRILHIIVEVLGPASCKLQSAFKKRESAL
jgi:hypothetical protein